MLPRTMGWNFGGSVIHFDYRAVVGELEERAQLRLPGMPEDELAAKDRMDAGVLALGDLGIPANPADAPADFSWVTSRDFDAFACAVANGRTVLMGRDLGLGQSEKHFISAACSTSARRREVLLFWLNDASNTYQFSVFRAGKRVRCWSAGVGMTDDDGPPLPAESGHGHGFDRVMAVLKAATGAASFEQLTFEVLARA
jgi:hypothetical protein